MGNCQAVDTASLVIQHPSGKSEMLFCPIPAGHIMKSNPGHYVALLINTTTTTTTTPSTVSGDGAERRTIRITRVKLLKPTDTLTLGHVYRLIATQEVMKELLAKKQAKMKQGGGMPEINKEKALSRRVESKADMVGAEAGSRLASEKSGNMGKYKEKQRSRSSRSIAWQPSLNSISEQSSKASYNKDPSLISGSAQAV